MQKLIKKKTIVTIDGLEPIIVTFKMDEHGNKEFSKYGLWTPFRRLKRKIGNLQTKSIIKRLGYTPHRCEGCGEGWAEYSIEEPNEPLGTYKKIFVCRDCVYYYDRKMTHKPLYTEPIDFRG